MITTYLQPYRYGGLLPDGPRDRAYQPQRYAADGLHGYVIADGRAVGPFNTGTIPGYDPDYPFPPPAPFPNGFQPVVPPSPAMSGLGLGTVFRDNVFGGAGIASTRARSGASLGGLFDFLDDEDVEAGDATGATTAGTPVVKDGTVIPGTAGPAAKQSPGAMPKFGACLKPYIDDPVNPKAFCILDPKGNYTCPPNQIYDPVALKCVPYTPDLIAGAVPQTGVICPYGTKAIGKACVSLATTTPKVGGGGGGLTPPSPDLAISDTKNALGGSTVPTWLLVAAGVAVVGGIGVVAYKRSQAGGKGGGKRGKKGGRR